jgi:chromosome segregation ATPase
MTATRRLAALLLAVTSMMGGCTSSPSRSGAAGAESGQATAQRFQDTPLEGRTPVESAIQLSEKYARLTEQNATMRQENQRLTADNESLRQQVASLETKLKQAQKELGEANDLLIEMLTELNNWKSNILGFRSEMRQAAQAQLEALVKVLEILGGQAQAGAIQQKHAGMLTSDPNGVVMSSKLDTPLRREPNGTR